MTYSRQFRKPKTMGEKRANVSEDSTASAGRKRDLPSSWDDIQVQHQRSWKKNRKSKYHAK